MLRLKKAFIPFQSILHRNTTSPSSTLAIAYQDDDDDDGEVAKSSITRKEPSQRSKRTKKGKVPAVVSPGTSHNTTEDDDDDEDEDAVMVAVDKRAYEDATTTDTDTEEPNLSPDDMLQLTFGFWHSQVLLSAVQLELFTKLAASNGGAGMTNAQIIQACQLHPRAVPDFTDALVALNLLQRDGNDVYDTALYSNTPETDLFLNQLRPATYIGETLLHASTRLYRSWIHFPDYLQSASSCSSSKKKDSSKSKKHKKPCAISRMKQQSYQDIESMEKWIRYSKVTIAAQLLKAKIDQKVTMMEYQTIKPDHILQLGCLFQPSRILLAAVQLELFTVLESSRTTKATDTKKSDDAKKKQSKRSRKKNSKPDDVELGGWLSAREIRKALKLHCSTSTVTHFLETLVQHNMLQCRSTTTTVEQSSESKNNSKKKSSLSPKNSLIGKASSHSTKTMSTAECTIKTVVEFACTDVTAYFLDRTKVSYIGGLIGLMSQRHYGFWADLSEALQTGMMQNEAKLTGWQVFSEIYMRPQAMEDFLEGMMGLSAGNFMVFREVFDFTPYTTMVDIGGACGQFASLVALRHPHMKSIITTDLPPVAPLANKWIQRWGTQDVVQFVASDFLVEDFPKADIITMSILLHDWNMEGKRMLIRKAYEALPVGGAFVCIETIIDDDRRTNVQGLCMSLHMLMEFGADGGFDFTFPDFTAWCTEAGFRSTTILPLAGPCSAAIAYK